MLASSTETPSAKDSVPEAVSPARMNASVSINAAPASIARNVLISYGLTFVGMLSGFIVTPFLLHHLGATQFGLWTLLNGIVGYTGLLEVGLMTALAKRTSECLAAHDTERLTGYLSTGFILYSMLAVVVLLVSGLLVLVVGGLFHLSGMMLETARLTLLVLAGSQCATFLFRLLGAVLYGSGRDYLLTTASIIVILATSFFNIFLVLHGYGMKALAVVVAVSTVVTGLLNLWIVLRTLPGLTINAKYASLPVARELLKFGSRNAALAVAGTISFGSDTLLIGMLMPVSRVAVYTIAARLVNVVNAIAIRPVAALLPAFAHSHAESNTLRKQQLFTEGISLSTGISLPFTLAFCGFGDRLVHAWVGNGHHGSGALVGILGVTYMLMLPGMSSCALVSATENSIELIRVACIAACINVALSVALTIKFGIVGVAIGSLVCVIMFDSFLLPRIACRQLHLPFKDYLAQAYLPLALPLLVSLMMIVIFHVLTLPSGAFVSLAMLAVQVAVCWGVWIGFGFGEQRRRFYGQCLRSLLIRRPAPVSS